MSSLGQLERTSADAPAEVRSLGGLFVASARAHADRTALVVDGVAVSYAELSRTAAATAATLRDLRSAHAPRLTGILASRTVTAYAGLLGALLAGDAYVPLNPRFPIDRLMATLEATQTATVVVDARAEAIARELAERTSRAIVFILPDFAKPPDWCIQLPQHQFVCRPDL